MEWTARWALAALIGAAGGCTDRKPAADGDGSGSTTGDDDEGDSIDPTEAEGPDDAEDDVDPDGPGPTTAEDDDVTTDAPVDTSAGETFASTCGNGIVEDAEPCDDGNAIEGDGCESDCSPTIVDVAAGGNVTCVRTRAGALRCWGDNTDFQLGMGEIGSVGDDETPALVGDVDVGQPVEQVVLSLTHTCALLADGAVRCWGRNQFGEAGYGHTQIVSDPPATLGDVDVGGTVIALTAGDNHTCALIEDGSVRCWGLNHRGQLGLGHLDDVGDDELPSAVPPIDVGDDVIQIESGGDHTCVLVDGGAVRCWGDNQDGQLGYGNTESIGDDDEPDDYGESILGIVVVELAAGHDHTCARGNEAELLCWGACTFGQCGLGMGTESIGDDEAPADTLLGGVPEVDGPLVAGSTHACAVTEVGLACWGSDQGFQLGLADDGPTSIGDDEIWLEPGPVHLDGEIIDLGLGSMHTCALLASGAVYCWGDGSSGALGYGATEPVSDEETPNQQGPVPVF